MQSTMLIDTIRSIKISRLTSRKGYLSGVRPLSLNITGGMTASQCSTICLDDITTQDSIVRRAPKI